MRHVLCLRNNSSRHYYISGVLKLNESVNRHMGCPGYTVLVAIVLWKVQYDSEVLGLWQLKRVFHMNTYKHKCCAVDLGTKISFLLLRDFTDNSFHRRCICKSCALVCSGSVRIFFC